MYVYVYVTKMKSQIYKKVGRMLKKCRIKTKNA